MISRLSHLLSCCLLVSLLAACGGDSGVAQPTVAPTPASMPSPTPAAPSQPTNTPLPASDIPGVEVFTNIPAGQHVPGPVSYPQTPPVGGPHNPIWLNCGIYDQPVANEHAVHSMEHGAVWVTYRPDLAQDDVTKLRDLVNGQQYVLLSPYPNLPNPVVASAWGLQLKLDKADDPRLAQFIREYANGPQNPEPGAPCSGAMGTPLQ